MNIVSDLSDLVLNFCTRSLLIQFKIPGSANPPSRGVALVLTMFTHSGQVGSHRVIYRQEVVLEAVPAVGGGR